MDEEMYEQHFREYTYHFFFVHGIYEELADIDDFVEVIDKFLQENLKVAKEIDEYKDNPRFHPELQFGSTFPDILWRSAFIHCYFLLESRLDEVCRNLQSIGEYQVLLNDIAGKGIFRAATYLRKVCDVTEPFSNSTWAKIVDYNKIRNILAHSDGIVKNNIGLELAKRNPLPIAFVDLDTMALLITKEFVKEAVRNIELCFQGLHKEMNAKKPNSE